MWFIGDIHGEFDWYLRKGIHGPVDCSIQLGDFGWGFQPVYNRRGQIVKKWSHMRDLSYIPPMPQHRFICGNHDDRMLAKQHPNYLGDFGFVPEPSIFFISGGYSADWEKRKPGVEWWEYEELTDSELQQMVKEFASAKPRIVVSHEVPVTIVNAMFPFEKILAESRTALALARALESWQPEHWVFGHYHATKRAAIGETRFQCVGEVQRIELPDVKWH